MRQFYPLLLLLMVIIAGCSHNQKLTKPMPNPTAANVQFPKPGTNLSISDCSNLIIPKNTEVNTNVNKEKGLLSISWYDDTKENDVTYTIPYTDKDCSESVKQLISHVIKTELPSHTPLQTVQPSENAKKDESLKCKLQLDNNFLAFASKGQLEGFAVKIGSSRQDILTKLGQPDETGTENSEYFTYRDCASFYFDDQKYVSAITVDGKEIGFTNTQLTDLLKKPLSEGADEEDGGYYILYETEKYQLYFNSETKDGVITNLLFKEKN